MSGPWYPLLQPAEVKTSLKGRDEYQRMVAMMNLYRPEREVEMFIYEAYHALDWCWKQQSDGCTGVTELHSPPGVRYPPCVAHDYWCHRARQAHSYEAACRIRREGDALFLAAMLQLGCNPIRAWLRFFGVRFYWLRIGKWKEWHRRRKINRVLDGLKLG